MTPHLSPTARRPRSSVPRVARLCLLPVARRRHDGVCRLAGFRVGARCRSASGMHPLQRRRAFRGRRATTVPPGVTLTPRVFPPSSSPPSASASPTTCSAEHPSDRHGIPGYDPAETHAACQAAGRVPQRPADALRSPAVGARLRRRWREARRERSHRRRGCGGGSSTGGLRRLLRGGRPRLRRDPRGQVAPRVAPAREHPQGADGSDPPAPARPAHRRGRQRGRAEGCRFTGRRPRRQPLHRRQPRRRDADVLGQRRRLRARRRGGRLRQDRRADERHRP